MTILRCVLILFALVVTVGCTTADEAIPTSNDALIGQTGIKDRGATTDAPDLGTMGQQCLAGNRLGLCEECDLDGQPIAAQNDGNCPPIDCTATGQYEQVVEEESVVCYQNGSMARLPGNCIAVGQCATLVEYCGENTRVEALRMPIDPCASMIGCQGNQAPTIQYQPIGASCNRTGSCEAGPNGSARCSLQVPIFCRLGENPAARFFCESGTEDTKQYCEYFVSPPNGGRTRCIDFCQSLDMEVCDTNQGEQCCWNNANPDNCDRLEGIICAGEPCMSPEGCTDMICRCYLPDDMQ
jgi:hypothetical protein